MNRDHKWYVAVKDLFEYPGVHPIFFKTELHFDAITRLKNLYTDLSGSIHGRKVKDLEMRVALKKIAYEQSAFDIRVSSVEKCVESANFAIAAFNCAAMRKFQAEDRRILLRSMPAKARKLWNDLE